MLIGIRQIEFTVATAKSDHNLIAAINVGKYKIGSYSLAANHATENEWKLKKPQVIMVINQYLICGFYFHFFHIYWASI